jgi:hypothetical protein
VPRQSIDRTKRRSLGMKLAALLTEPPVMLFLLVLLGAGRAPLRGVDRCADARDDIHRAMTLAQSGQETQARSLLRSALFACPAKAENLELLAEAFDSLGELAQAGRYREQAMRLRGISAKPTVNFSSAGNSVDRGLTTTLNWTTRNAIEVEISPDFGRVPANGTKTVAPTSGTTYQLTARGPGGVNTASVQIEVTLARLTEADVLRLLEGEVPQPRIVQLAAERGVAFEVVPAVEQRLRSAGATQTLIEALRSARK